MVGAHCECSMRARKRASLCARLHISVRACVRACVQVRARACVSVRACARARVVVGAGRERMRAREGRMHGWMEGGREGEQVDRRGNMAWRERGLEPCFCV